ncbi:MAG: ADP-forming succinate--CoA ligase subunit beta [Ardenticatenaceae bacterium]|nr:ADP-forming succinate--CoA ligase subunit beta [Ardenticatenaceae bacterium]
MNLYEYQAKRLFAEYGIPIPNGDVARTPEEAHAVAEQLGGRVVVKSQVHTGGRGKAGGVKLADDPADAQAKAKDILGLDIKGHITRIVLIDEIAPGGIEQEIYLAILIDRAAKKPMIMASYEGGMDIEEVAATQPDKIFRVWIDPSLGLRGYHATYIASGMGLPKNLWKEFNSLLKNLYTCFIGSDASLCEINPLVITGEGHLMALDGKVSIDDSALSRQPKLAEMEDKSIIPPSELKAAEAGVSFIKLDGNIGCMVNGAGLAMTTMDIIKLFGGEPANFLDIGGGASAEKVTAALEIILSDPNVEAVLINIFGGITRGDDVARGIVAALDKIDTDVPIILRLAGTNYQEGLAILSKANLPTAETLSEAAKKAIEAAKNN